jgi:hypothetical protein
MVMEMSSKDIPKDLVMKILSKLPVECLVRLVGKSDNEK